SSSLLLGTIFKTIILLRHGYYARRSLSAPTSNRQKVGEQSSQCAQVAELVDALGSGPSDGNIVEVRVFSWAPLFRKNRAPGSVFSFLVAATSQHATQSRRSESTKPPE